MKTAQQVISSLPAKCYGKLLIDNSVIIIVAGEMGYRNIGQPILPLVPNAMEDFINECNFEDGVTIGQRKAMEWGSQFGWETGLADPDRWTVDGKPIKK